MKPLQKFWEDLESLEVALINRLVGNRCEVNVSLVTTAPLINRVLDLNKVQQDARFGIEMTNQCEVDGKCQIGKWREAIGELNPRTD